MPDFRFVIGAILAVAMLGLAGLGLLASVRLVEEARDGSLQRSRSLAFAERVDWRPIGDNDVARRLDALPIDPNAGVADAPAPTPAMLAVAAPAERAPAMPPPEAAAEPLPPATPARMTDRAAPAPEPGVETNLPELVSADASAAGTVAPEPAPERKTEMTAVALADEPDPVSPPAQSTDASPPVPEQVASAASAAPAPETSRADEPSEPPLADVTPLPLPPLPARRPIVPAPAKPRRPVIARAHVARHAPAGQQTYPQSGFSTATAQWPSYSDRFTSSPDGKKSRTGLTNDWTSR